MSRPIAALQREGAIQEAVVAELDGAPNGTDAHM